MDRVRGAGLSAIMLPFRRLPPVTMRKVFSDHSSESCIFVSSEKTSKMLIRTISRAESISVRIPFSVAVMLKLFRSLERN